MQVIKVKDKWSDYVIDAGDSAEDLYRAAMKLLTKRYDEGFWYENWDDGDPKNQWADRARIIIDADDTRAAWNFLKERSDFEYEYVELDYLQ